MFISANDGSGSLGPPRAAAMGAAGWPAEALLASVKALADLTRLRIVAVLRAGELAVGEIAEALGQSQPRVSRHMKLLAEAGLLERAPEGALVFYRLPALGSTARNLIESVLAFADLTDPAFARDAGRRAAIAAARDAAAEAYFARNAADWDQIRALHMPDGDIEAAMRAAAGPGPFARHVDVGVGTGQTILTFRDRARTAEGFDTSRGMLAVARARLEGLEARVRHGSVYDPPVAPGAADLVTLQQVLHHLADPAGALTASARLLAPGGVLLIVDFAPHDLEFLRSDHAHRRLGFSDAEVAGWCAAAGLGAFETVTLAPAAGAGLTVKIWTCRRPTDPRPAPDVIPEPDLKRTSP